MDHGNTKQYKEKAGLYKPNNIVRYKEKAVLYKLINIVWYKEKAGLYKPVSIVGYKEKAALYKTILSGTKKRQCPIFHSSNWVKLATGIVFFVSSP